MHKLDFFMYLCTMKSTVIISKRIEAIGNGVIFGYADLDLSAAPVFPRMLTLRS